MHTIPQILFPHHFIYMKTHCRFLKVFLGALIFVGVFSSNLCAQTDSVYTGTTHISRKDSIKRKKPVDDLWKDRVTYGSNFQLQFGTFTFIYLSPTIGYIPFKNFNVGVGFIYNYINLNYGSTYGTYSQSIFGTHTYARYYVRPNFFIQGQYDRLKQPNVSSYNPEDKTWVEYMMVGGGFRQPLSSHAGLTTSIMYNLTPSFLSIYPSRLIIQFGFIGTL